MPTYNFANVVDDHLMGITHVIRGSEYLSSTPKYNLLYEAFGWEMPAYIHCPPVMKDAQNKLSKRNGDASYQDLVAKGYLTEAVLNYIAAAGLEPQGTSRRSSPWTRWSGSWTPSRASASPPPSLTPLKLRAINADYIRAPARRGVPAVMADPLIDSAVHVDIDNDLLCANLQPRCEVLEDIPPQLDFFDAVPPFDAEPLRATRSRRPPPRSALEALDALLPLMAMPRLTGTGTPSLTPAARRPRSWARKTAGCSTRWALPCPASSRTPGGGTDLATMLGREETLRRLHAAVDALRAN